ncbi:MAG: biotin/lipoyl-containing protein, partial [Solimonas sp.]
LHERDCSAQRRHQKVVEEAPAPGMSAERRASMGKAACDAARAVGYVGAGTVEFIADQDGSFYFMEMNTRLQVEHPVTEMITGLDLVEWQLRVASGEPLPLRQEQVPLRGHSIEVRVYAEEPEKGFLPSIGTLAHYAPPDASSHVRVDTGVEQGDAISPHYDPMIAKLIVWDETRERAIERLLLALGEFRIVGVGNNLAFLSRLVGHAEFRAGTVDTGLIARESEALLTAPDELPATAVEAAALWTTVDEARRQRERAAGTLDPQSPWGIADGWRLNGAQARQLSFRSGEHASTLALRYESTGLTLAGVAAQIVADGDGHVRYRVGERKAEAVIVPHGEQLHVFAAGRHTVLGLIDPQAHVGEEQDAHGGLVAPMPGKIVALLAEIGAELDKGAPLLMMEAMKMEHTLCAPAKGKVRAFHCRAGEQVKDGVELVDFEVSA